MGISIETKEHLPILAKIIEWAVQNDVTISLGSWKEHDGATSMIFIKLEKNGKYEFVRFIDWSEFTRPLIQKAVMDSAYCLCLTKLEL